MKERELVSVPLRTAGGMWGAAIYLAVLAFPESKPKRHAFLEDVKAFNVKVALRAGWKGEAGEKYRARPLRSLERSGPLVTATRRLSRDRLWAAEIAQGLLLHQVSKGSWLQISLSIGDVDVKSLNAGAAGLARRSGRTEDAASDFAANFTKRAWRDSRPVLHLAMALVPVLDGLQGDAPPRDVMELVRRPGWLPEALRGAELIRAMLAASPSPLRVALPDSICLLAETDKI